MVRLTNSLALSVLLVAACAGTPSPSAAPPAATSATTPGVIASPAASPGPSASPALSPASIPTPASSPAEGGWPYISRIYAPVFGTDGTVFAITATAPGPEGPQRGLVAFDEAGRVKPGWPIDERQDSYFGPMAAGTDGSVFLEECGSPEFGCVLHRFGAGGRDLPGWPLDLPPDFACPSGGRPCQSFLDISVNGIAYLTHWRATGGPQILAIDASGKVKSGWPVSLDGKLYWSDMQVGSDGTMFILSNNDESADERLWAFTSDGKARAGWPVAVPGIGAYRLGPGGNVVLWALIDDVGELCSNPRRTLFTMLGADGKTLPGWPRGSTGFASRPVIGADGTVYYVSERGNVYAHDRAGEVKDGWPVAVPGAGNGCGPASPYLAPDGTIYVLGDIVEARSADGRARPGWPYRPEGSLTGSCGVTGFDTDCVSYPHAPTFGPDGTVYLIVYHPNPAGLRAEIVAVDREGQLKDGWPYPLPIDPASPRAGPLSVAHDGRLLVGSADQHLQGTGATALLLTLDPDGRLSD